jgi:hypothetical protein
MGILPGPLALAKIELLVIARIDIDVNVVIAGNTHVIGDSLRAKINNNVLYRTFRFEFRPMRSPVSLPRSVESELDVLSRQS